MDCQLAVSRLMAAGCKLVWFSLFILYLCYSFCSGGLHARARTDLIDSVLVVSMNLSFALFFCFCLWCCASNIIAGGQSSVQDHLPAVDNKFLTRSASTADDFFQNFCNLRTATKTSRADLIFASTDLNSLNFSNTGPMYLVGTSSDFANTFGSYRLYSAFFSSLQCSLAFWSPWNPNIANVSCDCIDWLLDGPPAFGFGVHCHPCGTSGSSSILDAAWVALSDRKSVV